MLCRCTVYINILQSPYTSGLLMNVPNALTTDYINHTADFFPCVFCVVMMSLNTSMKVKKVRGILCATAFVGVCLVFLHTNILTIVPSSNHDNVKTENRVKTSVPGPVNSTLPGIRVAHERVDISEKLPPRSNASVDNAGESRQKRRTILYACRIAECGGWADRQKGVVSAYVLSVLLDRDFKLDMPRPCDVSVFMLPDQVNWTLAPNETHGKTTKKLFGWTASIAGLMNEAKKLGDFKIPDLDADYVFITWNLEMVNLLQKNSLARRVPWLDLKFSVAEIYNYVLRKLFKPVPDLRAKMIDLQRSRPQNTKLVCAQVRMGLSQHFDDEKQATFNTMDSLLVLWNFLRPYNDSANYRVFFASDNKDPFFIFYCCWLFCCLFADAVTGPSDVTS
ncbi:uncharacterized protein [Littorina saxatilis]|uniref:uncharacterized protein isoform X2 n=1 Tax=Littorina saxatilis TaxID=31220 RepID=UPI0038B64BCF